MNESLLLFQKFGYKIGVADACLYLGKINLKLGNNKKTLDQYQATKKLAQELNNQEILIRNELTYCNYLITKKKLNSALVILNKLYHNKDNKTSIDLRELILKKMIHCKEKQKKFTDAYLWQSELMQLKDSLNTNKRNNQIDLLNSNINYKKAQINLIEKEKDIQILEKNKELSNKNNIILNCEHNWFRRFIYWFFY